MPTRRRFATSCWSFSPLGRSSGFALGRVLQYAPLTRRDTDGHRSDRWAATYQQPCSIHRDCARARKRGQAICGTLWVVWTIMAPMLSAE